MAGNLKLELAQYREVEGFTKLGLTLDDATKQLIDRGVRLTSILIQGRYNPIPVFKQILILYCALNGFLDSIGSNFVNIFETELYLFLDNSSFFLPFSINLSNELCTKIVVFLVWYFTYYFIIFSKNII